MPSARRHNPVRSPAAGPTAFTLVELLVVLAILGLLVTILMPSLARAKDLSRQAVCLTRVGGQMRAITLFAAERDGAMPVGPDGYNEMATNQIWIGQPPFGPEGDYPGLHYNAHGSLLETALLQPKAMFCPDDDSADPVEELAKIRARIAEDVYCSYLYRQLDAQAAATPSDRLDSLGVNHDGLPVRALVMDMNSLMVFPPEYNIPIRTNHRAEKVTIGFAAGHAGKFDNPDHELTLRNGDQGRLYGPPPTRLDEIFARADTLSP